MMRHPHAELWGGPLDGQVRDLDADTLQAHVQKPWPWEAVGVPGAHPGHDTIVYRWSDDAGRMEYQPPTTRMV